MPAARSYIRSSLSVATALIQRVVGVDFIAFIASTTLCIVHMESCRQASVQRTDGQISALQSLRHQQPIDHVMLERTLDIMKSNGGD